MLHPVGTAFPMVFEPNVGQTDPQVRFMSRGRGYSLFLTPAEAVLSLHVPIADAENQRHPGAKAAVAIGPSHREVVRMRIQGGNRLSHMRGNGKLKSYSNYYLGRDRDRWREKVPQYSNVEMEAVYPGIDLVYYGREGKLEYDFVVKPGADPSQILLGFSGSKTIVVDARGDLVLGTKSGCLRFQAPVVYQMVAGQRVMVAGRFKKRGKAVVGFVLGPYDPSRLVVIDPPLDYSTYLGGSGWDQGNAIAVDGFGDAYVTGTSEGTFPTTAGAFQNANAGGTFPGDVFVAKLDPTGSALLFSTYFGGSDDDNATAIALDASGHAYVTGWTDSYNLPTTSGAYQTAFSGGSAAFVAEFASSGALVFSTFLGGNLSDTGNGIALDPSRNIYVMGETAGSFITTPLAYQTTFGGARDIFVSKLDPTGSALLYSTYVGGSKMDEPCGIAVDPSGNAYVTGQTTGGFPTTAGAYRTTYAGGAEDLFVTKLDPTGSSLVYSTYLGGPGWENASFGNGIAIDTSGCAYITATSFVGYPTTPGAFQTGFGGGTDDVVITKLNATGSASVYSTYLGGSNVDYTYGITVDTSGDVYVTGVTSSGDFPTTPSAYQTSLPSGLTLCCFLSELDPTGSALLYSTYLGGTANSKGQGVAVDGFGNIYVTGLTFAGFPTTSGAFQTVFGGGSCDGFVVKFGVPFPTPLPTVTSTPTQSPTFTATPFPTSTVTPTPTVSVMLSCQNPLYLSRNRYSPKNDFPRLFARAIQCSAGHFSVMVYNSAGEHIRTLVDDPYRPLGTYEVEWDGKNKNGSYVASGVYLVCFTEPTDMHVAKVAILQ